WLEASVAVVTPPVSEPVPRLRYRLIPDLSPAHLDPRGRPAETLWTPCGWLVPSALATHTRLVQPGGSAAHQHRRGLLGALLLSVAILVLELIAGIAGNSVALLADA